jgi:SAM-dependent methyltransferase
MDEARYAPFARTYDLEYGTFRDDVAHYVDLALRTGGPVLELAVGTGRVALAVAREGIPVVGIDACPEMLAVLRRKLGAEPELPVRAVEADMRSFDVSDRGPFALALCPARAFLHLLTVEDQLGCLASVRRHLRDGGLFAGNLFHPDVGLISRGLGGEGAGHAEEEFIDPDSGRRVIVSCRSWYDPPRQHIRTRFRAEEVSAEGEIVETRIRELTLCWIGPRELEHLLARAGFELVSLAGDFAGTPFPEAAEELVWVARKA